jgi:transcriptional regulator with XRE-family HTH domain
MAGNQKDKKSPGVLGSRLRLMRDRADLSQSAVANEIGLNTMSILNYETGKRVPDAEILRKFAQLYGCTADYLLGLADHANAREEELGAQITATFSKEIDSLPFMTKAILMENVSRFISTTRQYATDDDAHFDLLAALCRLVDVHTSMGATLLDMRDAIYMKEHIAEIMERAIETRAASDSLTEKFIGNIEDMYGKGDKHG